MARKAMRRIDKNYQPPIPLDEAKEIIKEVNSYKRRGTPPFKNQNYAILSRAEEPHRLLP